MTRPSNANASARATATATASNSTSNSNSTSISTSATAIAIAIAIASEPDIPAAWGAPRSAARRSTVAIREPDGDETFDLSWGTLTARPGTDWVVLQEDGEAYPIKRDVFAQTYEAVAPGRYRKAAASRIVQVPPGEVALLATREGPLEVHHPDYVAIGPQGEVYANAADWVAQNLQLESP